MRVFYLTSPRSLNATRRSQITYVPWAIYHNAPSVKVKDWLAGARFYDGVPFSSIFPFLLRESLSEPPRRSGRRMSHHTPSSGAPLWSRLAHRLDVCQDERNDDTWRLVETVSLPCLKVRLNEDLVGVSRSAHLRIRARNKPSIYVIERPVALLSEYDTRSIWDGSLPECYVIDRFPSKRLLAGTFISNVCAKLYELS